MDNSGVQGQHIHTTIYKIIKDLLYSTGNQLNILRITEVGNLIRKNELYGHMCN